MTLRPTPTRSFDAGAATMQRVLTSLRLSLVDESVYDDLEDVLGPWADIDDAQTAVLTGRLQKALDDLLPAVRSIHGHRPTCVRAIELWQSDRPAHQEDARAHLRRLALATLDALDLLAPNSPEPTVLCAVPSPAPGAVLKPPCTRTAAHAPESVPHWVQGLDLPGNRMCDHRSEGPAADSADREAARL